MSQDFEPLTDTAPPEPVDEPEDVSARFDDPEPADVDGLFDELGSDYVGGPASDDGEDQEFVFGFDDGEDADVEVSVFAPTTYEGEPATEIAAPPRPRSARPPAQFDRRERRRRVKLQARRVRRIVRHVEPWSVLKISLVFYFCVWVIVIIAAVLLWSVAVSSGTVDKVESFVTELFGLETFEFNPDKLFRGFALGGLVLVIAGTAFNVLMCVLFNLISDLTGGLRITVIEEESARFRPTRRAVRSRRPVP